jgi:serine/threonine protein kinase
MALFIGSQLGPYEIVSAIGAGGMGEVYRARDRSLKRDIALKILPDSLSADVERLARFQREAEVLASLNHPNIAAIYGLENAEGVKALVMELVEGEDLAERIARGPTPLDEALPIAKQIAEALEAAHDQGIIHRDLKPANIKVRPDGTVKVLDFGLAKAVEPVGAISSSAGQSPTITSPAMMTGVGVLLGTAAYMAPEQARGRPVDKRADIWAFGCVLYEQLTGRAAFARGTITDTLAAIVETEPAWDGIPVNTPPVVRRLLRRCLEKDPRRRLRDVGDARLEIEEALTSQAPEEGAPRQPARISRRTAIGTLAGVAAGMATGGLAVSRYRSDATPRSLARFAIALPEQHYFTASFNRRVVISPDGTLLACTVVVQGGQRKLLIRSMRDLELKSPAEGAYGTPFFSTDGRWLAYFGEEPPWRLRKIALSGGAPVTICSWEAHGGGTWAADDVIYFVSAVPGGLVRVPAAGGEPVDALKIDFDRGERLFKFPHAVRGSDAILLTIGTTDTESFDDAHIAVFSPRTGVKRVLVEGGTSPCYSPSAHLVYARNGNLLAAPFDPDRLELTGQPFTVLEGVLMSRNTGSANFDISATGDLLYVPGRAVGGARTLHWVDRSGRAEQLTLPPRSYLHPRLSPDANRLAIEVEGSDHNVYVYDFRSGVLSNITTDGVSHWPVWSPDGRRIGYRSGPMGRFQLFEVPADRSGPPEQVLGAGISQSPGSYSPDGGAIAFTMNVNTAAPPKVAVVQLEGDRTPRPLDDSRYAQGSPKFSPAGRYLAYCSNESGRSQVYVQAFPGPGPKVQVSSEGGTDPVWRRDGQELFYRNGHSMMVVSVVNGPTFTAGRPQQLWTASYSHGMSSSCGTPGLTSSNYDVTADGQRFLMVRDDDIEKESSREMILVQGWAGELSRLSART